MNGLDNWKTQVVNGFTNVKKYLAPDAFIVDGLKAMTNLVHAFYNYMEIRFKEVDAADFKTVEEEELGLYGQEDAQSNPKDESRRKRHQEGQAKTSRKGAKRRGKEK